MDETRAFVIVAVFVIVVIAGAALYARAGGVAVRLSVWKIVAAALVVAAVAVGRNWAGYVLAGLGVLIALADTARLRRRQKDGMLPPVEGSDKS